MEQDIYNERKEKLWGFFNDKDYVPMRRKDVAMLLQVHNEDIAMLDDIINELVSEGKLFVTKRGKLVTSMSMGQYAGVFTGNKKGFGFVTVDGLPEDIFIPADRTNSALNKDRVLVKIVGSGRRQEGEVIKVLERGLKGIVGTFESVKGYGFVIPDDKKIGDDIYIPKNATLGAVTGHKVVVKVTKSAGEGKKNIEGKVVEILGHISDPGVDILSIVRQYDIPEEFSDKVYSAIEDIQDEVAESDLDGRADYRDVQMVTIDGEDAKDLDDAVSVQRLENGNFMLGVYIADVSHYVREGSVLDKEAYTRGTSVYLADRVIPMLPHKLSNGICSLNAGVDRLSLCCVMEINKKGVVVSSDVQKAVIRVDRRMSYTVVNDLLTNDSSEYLKEYEELMPMFKTMAELRDILLNKRLKRGAIEFDFDEAKLVIDEKGKPVDIVKRERNIATSIIEEFMLAANETIAERFYWLELPFVYRTHEPPDAESIERLEQIISPFGYVIKGSTAHPKSFQQLLSGIKDKPEEMIIQRFTLRSFKQARYTADNSKHFGLAADYYCHFTSPIRRYPDLQIHRIISEYLASGLDERRQAHYSNMLTEVCEHCSTTERRADEVERETEKYKMVEYMQDKVGLSFDSVISGVTSWGIYVELPNTIEGMVSVRELRDDSYIYDEDRLSYMGERTHRVYTIGDRVRVTLVRASLEDRALDFVFAEE
jgi:ribonuclease R